MSALTDAIARQRREIDDAESATRRELVRQYRAAYARVERELMALTRQIEAARLAGEPIDLDWVRRQGRYRRLLASIDAELDRFATEARIIVADGQRAAVEIGANGATATARAAGYSVGVGSATVVPAAQERLVSALQPGSPLFETLGRYDAITRAIIDQELFTGLAAGTNPREVARRIRQLAGEGVAWRLETLARTEMMRALNGALSEQFRPLGVIEKIWTAALSGTTCAACLARHGSRWPLDAEMHSHPRCRCCWSPAPRVVTPALRPFLRTGDEWLARQPIPIQRQVLGSDELVAAFRQGDVRLADFVQERTSLDWGTTTTAKSPARVLRERRRRIAA